MTKSEAYQILGLQRNASLDEIKSAYKKLAKKYHPDLNPGDKQAVEEMKKINEAFSILTQQQRQTKIFSGPNDIFEQFFGARTNPFVNINFDSIFRDSDFNAQDDMNTEELHCLCGGGLKIAVNSRNSRITITCQKCNKAYRVQSTMIMSQ